MTREAERVATDQLGGDETPMMWLPLELPQIINALKYFRVRRPRVVYQTIILKLRPNSKKKERMLLLAQ